MEGTPLELRPGCIHQAWDRAFTGLAVVWPSTTPDHWWVEVHAKPVGGLIPTGEVEAALELADFHAEKWSVWKGKSMPEHPRQREGVPPGNDT
jgi:hypothetical protein